MAEYARLRLSAWSDPRFKRGLTGPQKLLLLYYRSSPHSNLIGLYSCPPEYAAAETGLTVDEVREWSAGALSPWITYDPHTEEVFVHDAGTDQVGDLKERDNRVAAIVRVLESMHSLRLVRAFLAAYAHWPLPSEGALKGLARASEAFPSLPFPPLNSPTQRERVLCEGHDTRAHASGEPSPVENLPADVDNSTHGNLTPQPETDDAEQREAGGFRGVFAQRQGNVHGELHQPDTGGRARRDGNHQNSEADSGAGCGAAGRDSAGNGKDAAPPERRPADGRRAGPAGLSDDDAALAELARDFHAKQDRIRAARGNVGLQGVSIAPVIRVVPVPGEDGLPMPERLTPDQVVALWASRQAFPPDHASMQRQAGAAGWLAKQPAEHVVRAMYGIEHVWPHKPPKSEAWTCEDVRAKWDKALQASEKHPALVDARTAQAINDRMNGG